MSALCGCGCGEATRVATKTDRWAGQVRGVPLRFIAGHNNRLRRKPEYAIEDRGYLTPCWIWGKNLNDRGYGLFVGASATGRVAHRVIFERERGPVPAGLELDHLCRVRACVNPDHLEPVTHQENMRRGYLVSAGPAPAGFPSQLRAARYAACLSQSQLAVVLGCSQSLIGQWERGRGMPGPRYANAVAEFLDPYAVEGQREPVRSAA